MRAVTGWAVGIWLRVTLLVSLGLGGAWLWLSPGWFVASVLAAALVERAMRQLAREWAYEARSFRWWSRRLSGCGPDALDLDAARLSVIRTVIEVAGRSSFKPYPKSRAGRRTVPLPGSLVDVIREHLRRWPALGGEPLFANEVGAPLRRTLFRSRVWRPALVRAGLLGAVVPVGGGFEGAAGHGSRAGDHDA